MGLQDLSRNLLYEILIYVDLKQLLTNVALISKLFQSIVSEEDVFVQVQLVKRYIGRFNDTIQVMDLLRKIAVSGPKVLDFEAFKTSGGTYQNNIVNSFVNIFEYSATTYTSYNTKNVLVSGQFTGGYQPNHFNSRQNQDIEAFGMTFWAKPYMYLDNFVLLPDDIEKGSSLRFKDINDDTLTYWRQQSHNITGSYVNYAEVKAFLEMGYYCELYCLVNEIAIGRPAMFTCPVKTIMIFFTLINQSPPDYSNYHDINSVKTLNEKFEGQITSVDQMDGYIYAELEDQHGSAIWMQYTEVWCTFVKIKLRKNRLAQQMHVLLIDMDNRTANFNMNEVGIDVSYVVPLGYVIEVSK